MAQAETMQAWRLPEFNEDPQKAVDSLYIESDAPVPQPGKGELLIKVHCASLNPIDWKLMTGSFQDDAPIASFPYTPGFDVAGKVMKSALGFNIGDKVIANLGLLESCKSKPGPNGPAGALAQFAVVPVKRCVKISKGTKFQTVAGLPLAGLTSYQGLFGINRSGLNGEPLGDAKNAKRVLILGGASGTGSMAVQMAKHEGCLVSATASTHPVKEGSAVTKMDLVDALGADFVIDYEKDDWGELLKGANYDIIFDCVGNMEDLTEKAPKVLKKGGQFVSTANFEGEPTEDVKYAIFLVKSDKQDLKKLVGMVENDDLVVPIDSVYEFDDAKEAFNRSLSGHATGKVLVKMH